jgi:hypothetical protein
MAVRDLLSLVMSNRRDSRRTVMRHGVEIGILLSVAVVRAADPAFDHGLHELPRASMSDHQFIIEDSGDEEARDSSPTQERVIERPAFVDTVRIWADFPMEAEFTAGVG